MSSNPFEWSDVDHFPPLTRSLGGDLTPPPEDPPRSSGRLQLSIDTLSRVQPVDITGESVVPSSVSSGASKEEDEAIDPSCLGPSYAHQQQQQQQLYHDECPSPWDISQISLASSIAPDHHHHHPSVSNASHHHRCHRLNSPSFDPTVLSDAASSPQERKRRHKVSKKYKMERRRPQRRRRSSGGRTKTMRIPIDSTLDVEVIVRPKEDDGQRDEGRRESRSEKKKGKENKSSRKKKRNEYGYEHNDDVNTKSMNYDGRKKHSRHGNNNNTHGSECYMSRKKKRGPSPRRRSGATTPTTDRRRKRRRRRDTEMEEGTVSEGRMRYVHRTPSLTPSSSSSTSSSTTTSTSSSSSATHPYGSRSMPLSQSSYQYLRKRMHSQVTVLESRVRGSI